MPPNQEGPEPATVRFMLASRLHLGLIRTSPAPQPPRQVSGPLRQTLHALIVAGLLGGLLGEADFATLASRLPELTGSLEQAEGLRSAGNASALRALR